MNKHRSILPVLFAFVMLFCVLFVVWYLPSLNERRFRLEDVRKSIETSLGRERKQQMEYDETAAALPEVQAELDRLLPLNEALNQEVSVLKEERKKLRMEKKELESQLADPDPQEVTGDE